MYVRNRQSWALPIKIPIIENYQAYIFLPDLKNFRPFTIGSSSLLPIFDKLLDPIQINGP
jgi:hypothetical protein